VSRGPYRLLDALSKPSQIVIADRTTLAGLPESDHDLVPAERFTDSGALEHAQAGGLDGREPTFAEGTLAPPPDRQAVIRRPAVDDPAVRMPAERAVHRPLLSCDVIAGASPRRPDAEPRSTAAVRAGWGQRVGYVVGGLWRTTQHLGTTCG